MDFDAAWQRSFGRLNVAIQNDNYPSFMELIAQNEISINSPDNRGYLPIHLACLNSNPYQYLIELLKFDIVNVNSLTYDGSTSLILICKNSNYPSSKEHLINSIKLLTERGGDVNRMNDHLEFPLYLSVENEMYEIFEYFCSRPEIEINKQNIYGKTSIYETLSTPSRDRFFKLLLHSGASIENITIDMTSDFTLLSTAINFENLKAVEHLIEVAKEKGVENYVNIRLKDGTSPLMIACQKNFLSCIRVLLDNGADVNAITTDQVSVIHFVSEFCDLDVLKIILEKFDFSILPNFQNTNDKRIFHMKNPLHLAISSYNENVIKYFIDHYIFSANSIQAIQQNDDEINGVFDTHHLFLSALGFALSIRARRTLIDYLVQSGGLLDFHSEIILPPVQCVFSSFNTKKDHFRLFNHLIKIGFDINKFVSLRSVRYSSNLSLVVFNTKLMKKFINYGFDVDDLMINFEHLSEINSQMTNDLLETFRLIPLTRNVHRFWNCLRSQIQTLNSMDENITKIDELFETPSSLTKLCKHQFYKTIWRINRNTAKFHENIQLYLPSTIVDLI